MANLNLNKVVIAGRLTSDPELKTTQNGVSVTTFSVAVNRAYVPKDGERQADFINCTAWRQTAEFITKYFAKGSSICVVGSIQTRKWENQDGETAYYFGVAVDEAMFVDSKSESAKEAPVKRERSERDTALAAHTGNVFTPEQLDEAARKVDGKSAQESVGAVPRPEMESVDEDDLPF